MGGTVALAETEQASLRSRRSRAWRAETRHERAGWRAKPRRRTELGLLFVGFLVVVFAAVLESLGVTGALPARATELLAGLAGLGVVVQVVNRRLVPDADPVIMPVALVLNGLGYVMIERLHPSEAGKQVAWTLLGIFLYFAVLAVVRRSRDLERYRYVLAALAFVMLVSPLMPVIGKDIGGARLWVGIGSTLEFQPVEVAKILLVVFFASFFVEKRELLTIPTRRVGNRLVPDLRVLAPVVLAAGAALLIILAERDVGFSLIIFLVFMTLLWATTGRWGYVIVGLVLFAGATLVAAHVLGQVGGRFAVWLDPWKYYNTSGYYAGYQPVQGELAFGRGGLFGSGLGLGLVHYDPAIGGTTPLPVATSDFIFAAFGEELGLVGTAAIMVGFLLIIGAGMRAALRARSDFSRLLCAGLALTFGFQTFFIMAGVTRLLPLTGVTLPLVSYGGSSLVANYALLAIVMRISEEGNSRPFGSGLEAEPGSPRVNGRAIGRPRNIGLDHLSDHRPTPQPDPASRKAEKDSTGSIAEPPTI